MPMRGNSIVLELTKEGEASVVVLYLSKCGAGANKVPRRHSKEGVAAGQDFSGKYSQYCCKED